MHGAAHLKEFLDRKVEEYNRPSFIGSDPVSVPHSFSKKQDVEIAALFAATFAWGNRTTIINKCRELMVLMDNSPHSFIVDHRQKDLRRFEGFCHRTFNATDLLYFISFLRDHYKRHASLEDAFVPDFDSGAAPTPSSLRSEAPPRRGLLTRAAGQQSTGFTGQESSRSIGQSTGSNDQESTGLTGQESSGSIGQSSGPPSGEKDKFGKGIKSTTKGLNRRKDDATSNQNNDTNSRSAGIPSREGPLSEAKRGRAITPEPAENYLNHFYTKFFSLKYIPERTRKHIAAPMKNSACKRLNMFLRWMVRDDGKGVDFGLWKKINTSELIIPLDLHVARVAKRFDLLHRPNADWQGALDLTKHLRAFDANDPTRYDFALFALGVIERF